jgi:hypothetical protein
MTPPVLRSRIVSMAFLVTSIKPKKLISICCLICFSDSVSKGPLSPYLLLLAEFHSLFIEILIPRIVDNDIDTLELFDRSVESLVNRLSLGDV